MEDNQEQPSIDYDVDYFGMDSNEDEDIALSWRMDPETSLSDWTILVKTPEKIQEYHVHKNILAVGRCKSDYFCSVFRNSTLESQTNTSEIELDPDTAQQFPLLLDFMYSHQVNVDTENAAALRYLAQYFGIRRLHRTIMKYVMEDMGLDNVATYITTGLCYQDERILSLAANICVDNIGNLHRNPLLLAAIDPPFFLRILSCAEIDTCGESLNLSKLVADYCTHHQQDLDSDVFEHLTSKKHMPLIHRDAAMPLLRLEGTVNKEKLDPPSCLQRRCTKVLALSWQDFPNKLECQTLPPPILAELLQKSLSIAKQHMEQNVHQHKQDLEQVRQETDMKMEEMQANQAQHKQELAKMKHASGEKNMQLRAAVAERDRQMLEYEKELNKFVRLEATHSFCLSDDTYHHLSGKEPFDNMTRFDKYGRNRPSAIPRYADSTEDGYLYNERKGTTKKRWPVYYYKEE